MRRTILLVLAACILTLVLGGVANAQGQSYPPGGQVSPAVEAGGSQDGTAFTGGETRFPTMAAGALLVLGSLTLYVARRRAKMFLGQ